MFRDTFRTAPERNPVGTLCNAKANWYGVKAEALSGSRTRWSYDFVDETI